MQMLIIPKQRISTSSNIMHNMISWINKYIDLTGISVKIYVFGQIKHKPSSLCHLTQVNDQCSRCLITLPPIRSVSMSLKISLDVTTFESPDRTYSVSCYFPFFGHA